MTVQSIIRQLKNLGYAELKLLQTETGNRLLVSGEAGSSSQVNDHWLLDAILGELKRAGVCSQKTTTYGVLASLSKKVVENYLDMQERYGTAIDTTTDIKKKMAGRAMAVVYCSWLERPRYRKRLIKGRYKLVLAQTPLVQIGFKRIIQGISLLPVAVEAEFPGYTQSGVLAFVSSLIAR